MNNDEKLWAHHDLKLRKKCQKHCQTHNAHGLKNNNLTVIFDVILYFQLTIKFFAHKFFK